MQTSLESFYHALETLEVRGINVAEKRKEIQEEVERFKKEVESVKRHDIEDKKMSDLINEHLTSMKSKIGQWEQYFQEQAKREKFRESLENNFIIIIYGKVKAGKSTLGNFVAQHCLGTQKPEFRKYDKAGEHKTKELEVQEDGFAVKITECTSEIQLFKLGGMVWVDTPGLSSMTKENGELASQYIGAADYIIFPTSSDAPLQNDEITQIQELIRLSKQDHIRLIITKSDRTEEDEINNEIVKILHNKTAENRKLQEEDITNRLQDNLKDKTNQTYPNFTADKVFSISVITAKKGLEENDQELFEGSNITRFYESMRETLEKAPKLKQQSPYKTLIALIDSILQKDSKQDLKGVRNDLEEVRKLIKLKRKECENLVANLRTEIGLKINHKIATQTRGINRHNFESIFIALQEEIKTETEQSIQSEFAELIEDFSIRFNVLMPKLDTEVKDEYVKVERVKERSLLERTINFLTLDLFCSEETSTIKKVIGNNIDELKEHNRKMLQDTYQKKYLEKCKNQIERQLFAPCDSLAGELNACITRFEAALSRLRDKISSEDSKIN
ncbi:GTP-binding protein [Helicobacter sp. MIT 14-3879]|uniref:GTP-binding protein n=1 Tax=Helicobacter sp. MIT 14-3879 TaxID=2040649 RepID=UPI000E1FAFF0|nr:GTP-binding protein [Helicobacter sp. MIT 14-3879]RDU62215.1 hypothetical protein CQA44_07410 [Helicobacter sp. MIT 14-3879]